MDDNYFLFSIPAEPSTRNDDPVIGAENRIVDASLHRRNDDTENFDDIERYLETILHDDDGPLEIEDGSPSTKYSPERDDDNNDIIIVPIPPFNNGIDESRDPTAFSGDVEDSWPNNSPDPLVLAKPVHLYCPLVAVEDASTSIEESKNNENTRHDASPRNHQSHQRPTYADGNRKITACTFCGYEKVTKNKSTSDDVPHVCPNEIDDNDEVRVKHLLFKAFPGFREIDTYLPHDKLSASSGASDGEDIEKMIDEALEEQETNGRQDQEEREKDRATLLESLVPSKRAITTNEFAGRPDEEYSSGVSQSQGKRKRVRKGKDQHDGDDDVSDVSDRTDNNSDESYDDESYDDDEDETDKNKNKDHSSDEA
ncbi:hypothetical protein IV203_034470 [Nitzschia inconspicua]|uniref:Uncharacterized protein n=1 Tax=Nitzschia inconspicua TaxID=303405 RepID=A0A9K3LC53_9STRA|nr:hypothetical protein IV203_034470 [Nitzschia inconspicua]